MAGPSSNDLWGVGYVGNEDNALGEVRRFDGTRWHTVYKSSEPGTYITGVSWFSDDDVWATCEGFNDRRVMLHWDGTAWSRVRLHASETVYGAELVDGASPSDVWAKGYTADWPVLEHWNGTSWSSYPYPRQSHPAQLTGLTATYPDSTWAAGYTDSFEGGHALLLHWTGAKWVNEAGH